ncbi:MAG TPA: peptidoglycan-binding domain-containing protein [Puia sp.]|nr:peptidoglycan-binding domain-containing protein [Puia sp.]
MTGQQILDKAKPHIGEPYILGSLVPKNDPNWRGPWDCAEFVSWVVYQVSGKLYGCNNNLGDPARADAYTGYWRDNAETMGKIISIEEAVKTPGAAILRAAATGTIGHIVISNGQGGTVEAHSHADGVIASVVNGRRWDYGILVPWIEYASAQDTPYTPPNYTIYRYTQPMMISPVIGKIQTALTSAGFPTGGVDNVFGPNTLKAVEAFQAVKNLVVDGEVGKDTAAALGIAL